MDQADDRVIEDADVLDSDSDVPLLGLGLGGTGPAEAAAPLGTEPAEVALLSRGPASFPENVKSKRTKNHCRKLRATVFLQWQ